MLLVGAVVFGATRPTHAQGLGTIVRGIARAVHADTAVGTARQRGSGPAGPVASGGALRIVDQHVDGPDSLAHPIALDTGLTRVPAPGACGTARVCVPGWELRVLRVALPGPLVPARERVLVTTEVENRGRQPAPAAELRLCVPALAERGCHRTRLDVVTLPALAPGERAVVRRAITWPVQDRELADVRVVADLDQGHTPGAHDAAEHVATSAPAATRLPSLEILTLDVPADAGVGTAFPVVLVVRNTSSVAASPATELQLAGSMPCPAPVFHVEFGGAPNRVAVPELGPRQTARYRLLVPDAARCHTPGPARLTARLDPENRGVWSPGQERLVARGYSVR